MIDRAKISFLKNAKKATLTVLLFFLVAVSFLYAEERAGIGQMAGVRGGYSQVLGYYGNEIYNIGSFGVFGIPYIWDNYFAELGLTFYPYALTKSNKSALYNTALSIMPAYYTGVGTTAKVYAGVSLNGNFVYLNAEKIGKKVFSFKPGLSFETGLIFPFKSVNPVVSVNYSVMMLSNKAFHTINFFVGVAYNFSFREDYASLRMRGATDEEKSEIEYEEGLKDLQRKNITGAEEHFRMALSLNRNNMPAKGELAGLEKAKEKYKKGIKLSEKGDNYGALALLVPAQEYFPKASEEVSRIRAEMSSEITVLEKEGIKAYEERKYKKTIEIMNKIILIDPDNETAAIYLQKAEKRYEAIQKLH